MGLFEPMVPRPSLYFVSEFIFRKNGRPLSMSDTVYFSAWFWSTYLGNHSMLHDLIFIFNEILLTFLAQLLIVAHFWIPKPKKPPDPPATPAPAPKLRVAPEADPLRVEVPEFSVRSIRQSTPVPGTTNTLYVTLTANYDLGSQSWA